MSERTPLLPRAMRYAHPSILERIAMYLSLFPLPLILMWTVLFHRSQKKSLKRVLHDRSVQHLVSCLNVRQLQSLLGNQRGIYEAWCKKEKLEPMIEDIGEGASLLWIGERNLDKVILHFHGGAFLFPSSESTLAFLYHTKNHMKQCGINTGVVMLEYTLIPESNFPTPLKQAVTAINHLMNLNVDPQNMQLMGDSAGGNLILQVLSHLLHPLESENVPQLSPPAPFRSIYLMSPWVDLSDVFQTLSTGDKTDTLSSSVIKYWGSQVLNGVPSKFIDYIEPNSAAEDWWKGIDAFADRVLITAGTEECLKNEIIRFEATFDNFHANVALVQKEGVHCDPLMDFDVGEKNGELTNLIVNWLARGFQDYIP